MDRETLLLLALGMLTAAALIVGLSGWTLLVRDRRLTRSIAGPVEPHPEAPEGT